MIVDHLRLNVTNNVPRTSVLDATMELNIDIVGIARGARGIDSRTSGVDDRGASVLTPKAPVLFMTGGLMLLTAREPVLLAKQEFSFNANGMQR
jgi:hypothetical protein